MGSSDLRTRREEKREEDQVGYNLDYEFEKTMGFLMQKDGKELDYRNGLGIE